MSDTDIPRAHRSRNRSARGESSRRDRPRKKESRTRRGASSADEGRADRRSRSKSLSANALAQLNQDNVRQQKHADRERRKRDRERGEGHDERARERLERQQRRERERRREREVERDRDREREMEWERERQREREREQRRTGARGRSPSPDPETEPVIIPKKYQKPGRQKKKSRVVSGAVMEEGRSKGWGFGFGGWGNHSRDGSYDSLRKEDLYSQPEKKKKTTWSKRKKWIVGGICAVILLIIIIVAAVVGSKHKSGSSNDSSAPKASNGDVPAKWINTYLDPTTWASTEDFNTTFTDAMVGDLPIMGLDSDWDDSAQANDKVPALNKPWGNYSKTPARGVNLGGWLSIEPFITPSLFNYPLNAGVVDEWTLCIHLGSQAASTIENHYNTFVTESTFQDIANAGLDHVRIPFSYWAVKVYDGDQYIYRTSWRYLLRGIEWARKYGLRVNLDMHGLPGSQNGWNHSGRQGAIGWLNGTNGDLNAQRSLDIHNSLSQFFAQDRYKNIITHYGLANEPRMTFLKASTVVNWTETAYKMVRKNGYNGLVIFGDGFMGLDNWQGKMQGYDGLVLDVHQYVIFNQNQIDFTHQKKVQYACQGWTQQAEQSQDTSTGYGPTQFAEWSQADTDCAQYVTNVGQGNRWEGTLNTGNASTAILTPDCPTKDSKCSCDQANADPSKWSSEYKQFLTMFAEAQMYSFEKGLGWWYWTWQTETSPQWSYKAGMQAGVLPQKAWDRSFNCDTDVPDFSKSGLPEYY